MLFQSVLARIPTNITVLSQQVMNFSKFISKSRAARLPMNTKRAGKGYYKGNGARKEGRISSTGKIFLIFSFQRIFFVILWDLPGRFLKDKTMCTELVVPDLSGFQLKAYVGSGAKRNIRDKVVSL
jgi:hypothetical protein